MHFSETLGQEITSLVVLPEYTFNVEGTCSGLLLCHQLLVTMALPRAPVVRQMYDLLLCRYIKTGCVSQASNSSVCSLATHLDNP